MQNWPGCPAKFYCVKRPVVVWQSVNNAPSFDLTEYLGHLLFILFVGADVLIAVVSGHLKNYYSTQIKKNIIQSSAHQRYSGQSGQIQRLQEGRDPDLDLAHPCFSPRRHSKARLHLRSQVSFLWPRWILHTLNRVLDGSGPQSGCK